MGIFLKFQNKKNAHEQMKDKKLKDLHIAFKITS